jgi:hypothetical protein
MSIQKPREFVADQTGSDAHPISIVASLVGDDQHAQCAYLEFGRIHPQSLYGDLRED